MPIVFAVILGVVLTAIGISFLLPYLFGVDGIWRAMFATEVGACLAATIFFIAERKKYNCA